MLYRTLIFFRTAAELSRVRLRMSADGTFSPNSGQIDCPQRQIYCSKPMKINILRDVERGHVSCALPSG
jgi:hypothetical protein